MDRRVGMRGGGGVGSAGAYGMNGGAFDDSSIYGESVKGVPVATSKSSKSVKGLLENGTPNERKALGLVEDSHKMALVVASGKALKKVETQIQQKTKLAKRTEKSKMDVSRFSGYNGSYHQILRSCKSPIPPPITRTFDVFESRLECMSLGHLGVVWDTRMRRNQIMRLAAVEIYNEISSYWLWPLDVPDIDRVIDRSMKRVARLVSKDYRAPVKVRCCGVTWLRCCCRRRDPKQTLLESIFVGLEGKEEEMMEARQVTKFIDTGERRTDGEYLDEEDAFEAEKRLRYLEEGDGDYSYYSREDGDGSYYSRRSGYSRGSGYDDDMTEESNSYMPRSARGGYSRSGRSRMGAGDTSLNGTLTASESEVHWEDASMSEYGSRR